MPNRLSEITSKATLREYSQGAAQSATQPVADFLAPTVNVAAPSGYFKKYNEKSRFRIPNTERALGGDAVRLGWAATDGRYDCTPHALDIPLDKLEIKSEESCVREAAQMAAEVGGLAHEKSVIDNARAALGDGTNVDFSAANFDLVKALDTYILQIIKAAQYGSIMSVGIIFGAEAWLAVKNHKSMAAKFTVGIGPKGIITPKLEDVGGLFIGTPEARISMMVYDDAPEGKPEDIKFILENQIMLFARHPNPTRRDPSFMKTFRLDGEWMVPGTYEKEDGRGEVIKMDWSEDVQVTNPTAAELLNVQNG
jgi:hypothetical protein